MPSSRIARGVRLGWDTRAIGGHVNGPRGLGDLADRRVHSVRTESRGQIATPDEEGVDALDRRHFG